MYLFVSPSLLTDNIYLPTVNGLYHASVPSVPMNKVIFGEEVYIVLSRRSRRSYRRYACKSILDMYGDMPRGKNQGSEFPIGSLQNTMDTCY